MDAAIDLVGGAAAHTAFDQVRDDGRYVTSVPPYIDAGGVFDPARGISPQLLVVAPDDKQLTELLAHAADGSLGTGTGIGIGIGIGIGQTYPLEQAAAPTSTRRPEISPDASSSSPDARSGVGPPDT